MSINLRKAPISPVRILESCSIARKQYAEAERALHIAEVALINAKMLMNFWDKKALELNKKG